MAGSSKSRIDRTLINELSAMSRKEKKAKEFKRRVRAKGKIIKKGMTKNSNIRLSVQKGREKINFIVIKTHKERYALAEGLEIGDNVSAAGIRKLRAIICTQLKAGSDRSIQKKLVQ